MSRLLEIADRFEPKVRKALISAFTAMRKRVPLSLIQETLVTRGLGGIMDLLDGIDDDMAPVIGELDAAIAESGRVTVKLIPRQGLLNAAFGFDLLSSNTLDFIRNYRLNLIRQVTDETRGAIRQAIQADFLAGRNPRDTARVIRGSIGLNRRQEQALQRYRAALEGLDSDALRRKLRDKRFDRTVLRAIEEDRPLTKAQVERMVGRYRERSIAFRAETIARTESLRAVTVGNRASIRQMLATGAIDAQRVRRQWVYTKDARTRAAHRSVPSLNQGGVELEGVYQTELGPLAFPRDPRGSADNTIRCRCTERYFIAQEVA